MFIYKLNNITNMPNINFEVPEDLHKEFKILSIKKEKDMKDILVDLIRKEVDSNVP